MKHTATNDSIPAFLRHTYPELRIRDGPGEAKVRCPSHEDNEPSCSMNLSSGLWCCHACGASGDLIDFYQELHGVDFGTALHELNNKQWRSHKMEPDQNKTSTVVHPYTDGYGNTAYEVIREIDDLGKTNKVWQRRPDGTGGYINNLEGVSKTIYRREEVAPAKEVMIVEGEKDVERLRDLGLVATCNPGGAGKWRDEYSVILKGKLVTILADNDAPGRKHAQNVAQSLTGIAQEIRVVSFNELPEKSDVSDWLNQGHTKEELVERINGTPLWSPPESKPASHWAIITGDELLKKEFHVVPVFDQLLNEQEMLLLCGVSNIGKSTLTMNMALAYGHPTWEKLWGKYPIPKKGKTLFIQGENADFAMQDRLKSMCEFDPGMEDAVKNLLFPIINGRSRIDGDLKNPDFIKMITEIIAQEEAGLIVIDPLASYSKCDENNNTEMRLALEALRPIMEDTGASIIIPHHMNKMQGNSINGIRGASSINDTVDNTVIVSHAKGHDDGTLIEFCYKKSRNFSRGTPTMVLRRMPNRLYMPADEYVDKATQERHDTVARTLKALGGSVDKQAELKAALSKDTGKSLSEVQRWITDAAQAGHINEVPGPGRAKGYCLPKTSNPQLELAEAA